LKARIKHGRSLPEQVSAQLEYHDHLQAQYKDRQSVLGPPRAGYFRGHDRGNDSGRDEQEQVYTPALAGAAHTTWSGKFQGPELELEAALVHAIGLYIFTADGDMSIGSDWVCECVLQALSFTARRVAALGPVFAEHFHLQGDNTTSQMKTQAQN
jgi:hypothetical protein